MFLPTEPPRAPAQPLPVSPHNRDAPGMVGHALSPLHHQSHLRERRDDGPGETQGGKPRAPRAYEELRKLSPLPSHSSRLMFGKIPRLGQSPAGSRCMRARGVGGEADAASGQVRASRRGGQHHQLRRTALPPQPPSESCRHSALPEPSLLFPQLSPNCCSRHPDSCRTGKRYPPISRGRMLVTPAVS